MKTLVKTLDIRQYNRMLDDSPEVLLDLHGYYNSVWTPNSVSFYLTDGQQKIKDILDEHENRKQGSLFCSIP